MVSWDDEGYRYALAPSEDVSLSFVLADKSAFLGLYAISMSERNELVLTELPAPPQVLAAAAEKLGGPAEKPALRTRQLKRCQPTGDVKQIRTNAP
jgi:hypothetical protein